MSLSAPSPRSPWTWLAAALSLVYLRGLFLDVMDVDAAQYASISMQMLQSSQWLQVHYLGHDYLDKPPLLFWTAALSYRLFGLHVWAYKLPSLLAALLGVRALYRLGSLYYTADVARNAAFILASCVGLVLATNDVRTDAMLLGMTLCAVWHGAAWLHDEKGHGASRHLLLLGLFTGLAMLTKGPIGAVLPASAISTHLILRRDWRALFRWQWLVPVAVAAAALLPMCWGLYQQFDVHPDKIVNGHAAVSGLRFFFWDQSFGRITGSNAWKNDTSPFYFVHVYLWAFLPWPLFLMAALWRRIVAIASARFRIAATDEGFSIGALVLTFVALSLSHYKLPHYIFPTLPWAALLTARWFGEHDVAPRWWRAQYVVFAAIAFVSIWLVTAAFPTANPLVLAGTFGGFTLVAWRALRSGSFSGNTVVWTTALAGTVTAFTLNFDFYPLSIPFQSSISIAKRARLMALPADQLFSFNRHGDAMDFYTRQIVPVLASADAVADSARIRGTIFLYTDAGGRARLDSAQLHYTVAVDTLHFEVAQPTIPFLGAATRRQTLQPAYLLRVDRDPAER